MGLNLRKRSLLRTYGIAAAAATSIMAPVFIGSGTAGAATTSSNPVGPIVQQVEIELIQLENQAANDVSNVVLTLENLGCLTGTQDPGTCPPWL